MSTGQEVGFSPDPVHSLHTQLCKLQESISDTHDAVIAQTTAVNSVLQSVSVAAHCQGCLAIEAYSAQGVSSSGQWHDRVAKYETHISHHASYKHAILRQSLSPKLGMSLETSRNFFAESYTVDARVPISCLMIVTSFGQSTQVKSRTSVYKLLYLNTFRHWQWLTISMQVSCSSKYKATTKVSHQKFHDQNTTSSTVLSYTLLRKIQDFLCQGEALEDNATVYLSLSDGDIVKQRPQILGSSVISPPSWPASALSNAMNSLHDLECRRYNENEVVQIEMVDPPHCFCSSLNGILVYETKFMDSIPSVEMLYTIRVLYCMNGSSAFAKLIGIVTDDSCRYLRSYLVELPRASPNFIRTAGDTSVS